MRNYVPKSSNLPRWAYRTVIETVRGYEDMVKAMKEVADDEIHLGLSAAFSEVGSQGRRGASRPTEKKALNIVARNAEYERRVKAVEHALTHFEAAVQTIIMHNIIYGTPLKWNWQIDKAENDRTLKRKKRLFVSMVAQNLNLV